MAWRRENLRSRLISARSIEETGLDSLFYGDGFSYYPPYSTIPTTLEGCSTTSRINKNTITSRDAHLPRKGAYQDICFSHQQSLIPDHENKQNFISDNSQVRCYWDKDDAFENDQLKTGKRIAGINHGANGRPDNSSEKTKEQINHCANSAWKAEKVCSTILPVHKKYIKKNSSLLSNKRKLKAKRHQINKNLQDKNIEENSDSPFNELLDDDRSTKQESVAEKQDARWKCTLITNKSDNAGISSISPKYKNAYECEKTVHGSRDLIVNDTLPAHSMIEYEKSVLKFDAKKSSSESLSDDCIDNSLEQNQDALSLESSEGGSQNEIGVGLCLASDREKLIAKEETEQLLNRLDANVTHGRNSLPGARTRWMRLKSKINFVNKGDAGSIGAVAFEGVRTLSIGKRKGRKGMEALLVRQDKGIISFIQDLYVACLKLPIIHFLIGVFLVPVVLGLLFSLLYLLDIDGLSFDGVMNKDPEGDSIASTRHRCFTLLNVFLYALSLSTTFGGSPVAAVSPFCLLVANMNTLAAQFLFVFLSGAVFARMSQPSQPIRCSRIAIIKTDDVTINQGEYSEEKFKVFAIRLVLGGPAPCELVDVKICLTFRIFIQLPNGSTFCSTQDLDLVRSEVSYLRYGLMVRHVMDKKSPIYGHTLQSLHEGDASFSLTIMGLERSSMQPIFHLEDYFVCDGDVAWDRDYVDFIHTNAKGQRVLDHSKIDLLKPADNNGTQPT
ncbi:uncharacterized protein LOC131073294 [Cryptomeria japonica]|uniref:uncharacterized protein LOC131073294 n=1 Tax=Cryptomeria japonica TaxID=3369 RepID=UPI0025AB7053|nr:uncharacterized protein LOC131073294 [Cryptomeria japonica]XP_057865694.1 uncharacterized protein LOC131073294 [Cryptomeria japonica]XP_057865702.1 uncharacterized protein LOC131073294 [Cryptomeria japonica]XP_057865710.1 uncharacterized protein LOC131073294 [Cryptomeria japonica]